MLPPLPPQLLVKLRCPDHPPLSFCGSSALAAATAAAAAAGSAAADDSNSVDHDNAGPDSEAWRKALSREISKLRREAAGTAGAGDASTPGARGLGSWRLWNLVSGAVGGGASATAAAATAAEPGGLSGNGESDALEEEQDPGEDGDSFDRAFAGEEDSRSSDDDGASGGGSGDGDDGDDDEDGEREEKQGRQDAGERGGGGGGGGNVAGAGGARKTSLRSSRREQGGARFRR